MKKFFLTIAIGFAAFSGYAQVIPVVPAGPAPKDLGSHVVNISITEAADISDLNTDALNFDYDDAAAIEADAATQDPKLLDIKSNYAWKITAYASGDFTDGATVPKTIPLTVLKLNNTAITSDSENAVTIKTGNAGVSNNTKIAYKVKLGNQKWTYAPTDYSTTVYLTFSAQ